MKYDSSMTQSHSVVLAAVKCMCCWDNNVKEHANDGSPEWMRNYLKDNRSFSGACTPETHYSANKSGITIYLCSCDSDEDEVDYSEEKTLTLSWSQVTTFIRNNAAEIFDEPEEGCKESNMENEKSSPEIDVLDLDVKSYNTLKRAGINTIADVERLADNLTGTIQLPEAHRIAIEAYKAYQDSQGRQEAPTEISAAVEQDKQPSDFPCDNCGYDEKGCCNYPETPDDYCVMGDKQVPTTKEESGAPQTAAAFDYSELDADTAAKLENVTAEIFNVRKEYIFTMAKKVAYAHDLLANHYGGKFGAWCESIGISRDTGNNLVRVAELFGNSTEVEQENLNKLADGNVKLLYEAARPSAPPELVEQVKNGDITTHKEYIKLKKELEAAEEHNAVLTAEKEQFHKASKANLEKLNEERERNSELEKQLSEVKNSLDISEDDVRKAEERAEYAENKVTEISVKKHELEQRIKELESRPVDVATPDDEEIERIAAERSRALLRAKDMECDRRLREMQSEGRSKDKEISELKERLMTIGEDSEQIENFFEDMYNDAYRALKRCFEFVTENNFTPQTVNKLRIRLNSFPGVVKDFIEEME